MHYLALLLIPFVLVGGLFYWVGVGLEWLVGWWRDRRQRRIARIEAELDRQQAGLRATILDLADQLGADALEARKALIRESFLASGKVPRPSRSTSNGRMREPVRPPVVHSASPASATTTTRAAAALDPWASPSVRPVLSLDVVERSEHCRPAGDPA